MDMHKGELGIDKRELSPQPSGKRELWGHDAQLILDLVIFITFMFITPLVAIGCRILNNKLHGASSWSRLGPTHRSFTSLLSLDLIFSILHVP